MKDARELWCDSCKFTHSLWPGLYVLGYRGTGAHFLFFSQGDILTWKGLTSHQGRKTSSQISLVASGHGDKDMLYGFVCKIYAPKGYHKPKPPTLKERFGWHKSLIKLKSPKLGINDNKGLKLKLSAFKLSIWWPIYIINSVDNTKLPCYTLQVTQQHSFRNLPPLFINFIIYFFWLK